MYIHTHTHVYVHIHIHTYVIKVIHQIQATCLNFVVVVVFRYYSNVQNNLIILQMHENRL